MPDPVPAPGAADVTNPPIDPVVEEPTVEEPVAEKEFIDPGQFEGLGGRPKAEKEPEQKKDNSAKGRINDITKQFRTEERKNVELTGKLTESDKKAEDAIKRAEEAERKLKEFEAKSAPIIEVPKEPVKEGPTIDDEINELWAKHKKASAELDGEKTSEIFREIDKLSRKRDREEARKAAKVKPEEIDKRLMEKEADLAADEFKKKNTWFSPENKDFDKKKRRYALAVENELRNGKFQGTYRELLQKVEIEVEEAFSTKPAATGLPNVSGVDVVNNNVPKGDVIELNEFQKKVAHGTRPGMSYKDAEAAYIKLLNKQKKGEI
jgi:hypothetical protein